MWYPGAVNAPSRPRLKKIDSYYFIIIYITMFLVESAGSVSGHEHDTQLYRSDASLPKE